MNSLVRYDLTTLEKPPMKKHCMGFLQVAMVALFACGLAAPSQAETGAVRVVFTKGGFIIGVGSGHGVLMLRMITTRSMSRA
jgi:hypothetical protein